MTPGSRNLALAGVAVSVLVLIPGLFLPVLTIQGRLNPSAVAELSPPLRITLVLATVDGLPYRQISEILEVPEGTVAWRVGEARRLLRLRLQLAPAAANANSDRTSP